MGAGHPVQDYHWWWRSFVVSGGSAVYVFLYAIFYYATKLDIDDNVSTMLYFGYTSLMVLIFWIFTGAVEKEGGEAGRAEHTVWAWRTSRCECEL